MTRGSHRISRCIVTGLTVVAALVVPAQASAATNVSLSGGTLTIAAGNEASGLTVSASGGNLVVEDAALPVTQGSGCLPTGDSKRVTCSAGGVTALSANLGDGDDVLDAGGVSLTASVLGGNGDDLVLTGPLTDTISGEAGIDGLDGGLGNDTLNGGNDGDAVVYHSHTSPVTVSLGSDQQSTASTGNGQGGENDSLRNFEYVQGGQAGDTLTGDAGNNAIAGGPGNDTLHGAGGSDFVGYWERSTDVTVRLDTRTGGATAGGETDDIGADIEHAMGGAGDDLVIGNNAGNTLWGGWSDGPAGIDGDDVIRGGGGGDVIWGDQGVDTADYSDKSAAVTATIDGNANDGVAGEGDNIDTSVENVTGGAGNDHLDGTNGPNVLRGGAGNDDLNAFGGDDVVDGGTGGDVLTGGPGVDRADYSARSGDLVVDIGGGANDAGEGDNVGGDVEDLTGGSGNDTLTGSGAANVLVGGAGTDTLNGLGGNDTLDGSGGADTLSAGAGADAIAARDGAVDTIGCGADGDSGLVDWNDLLDADCEAEVVPSAAPPADPPPPVDPPAGDPPLSDPPAADPPVADPPVADPPVDVDDPEPTDDDESPVTIRVPSTLELSPQGDITIGVGCNADEGTCRGTIELVESNGTVKARTVVAARRRKARSRKEVVLGRKSFSVAAGRTKEVRVRLARRGRQRIIKKKKRKTRAKLVITVRAPDGTKSTTTKNVSISPPKERRTRSRGRSGRKKNGSHSR